ncbi:MAG: hypothetical protein EAZ07_08630 [Cytophagales bacterium]|nr:MAG: hypothetical protein EAZ07_08630 [Cytophagales bacterium]
MPNYNSFFFRKLLVLMFLCVFINISIHAQSPTIDSTETKPSTKNKITDHRPRNATLMSMALPGLGQVYNKRYWKVPIVYLLLSSFGAFVYDNASLYNKFDKHYKFMVQNKITASPEFVVKDIYNRTYDLTGASTENINFYREQSIRQRDLNFIGMLGMYVLNIIDANVDAHLRDFQISEDLSLNWKPQYQFLANGGSYIGLTLEFRFTNNNTLLNSLKN